MHNQKKSSTFAVQSWNNLLAYNFIYHNNNNNGQQKTSLHLRKRKG